MNSTICSYNFIIFIVVIDLLLMDIVQVLKDLQQQQRTIRDTGGCRDYWRDLKLTFLLYIFESLDLNTAEYNKFLK